MTAPAIRSLSAQACLAANSPARGLLAAAGALYSLTAARLLPAMAATASARVLPIWAGAHF